MFPVSRSRRPSRSRPSRSRPSRSRPSRSRASRSRPSHDGFAVRALGALLLSAALAGLGCGGGDAAPPVDEGEPTHQSFDRGVLCTPERLLRPETVEEVPLSIARAPPTNKANSKHETRGSDLDAGEIPAVG